MGKKANKSISPKKAAAAAAKKNSSMKLKADIGPGERILFKSLGGIVIAVLIVLFYGQTADSDFEWGSNIQMKSIQEIKKRALQAECQDRESSDRCATLAKQHGCYGAPGWMAVMCSATCDMCELLDPNVRCDANRIGYNPTAAYGPGDLGRMFRGLKDRYPEYNITYLLRPDSEKGGPWVVQLDNFLNDEEINALMVNTGMLKRSTDQGVVDQETGVQEQVVSQGRTSENAWCMNECERHPVVTRIQHRIADVVGAPVGNFESFQLLRYQLGQEYKRHHDMSEADNNLLCGPRVLTFFLYLSDVEEGGGTRFTDVDITMLPKKGSAILWPSVTDDDVTKQEALTHHEAMPVLKGTKFAANSWIHLYDYKIPNKWGCTGAFA